MPIYFLYARKSTDVEDKQVRSIEDQLAVLRALAKQEGLNIAEEVVEKQSAKMPGRPIFNEMLARIERGEAQGIICWKLDRLARNPIDGGQISWFLQKGNIQHIRTNDRDHRPTDNVLMMAVELGMANQYIIDLSANTKRGLHEKVKRGEYPSVAPVGYMNDTARKVVVMDRREAPVVRRAFELYAEGNSRLEDIAAFLHKGGIRTKATKRWQSEGGRPFKRGQISYILSNPFYIGFFHYDGELYEGKHPPLVSKNLFDKVQTVLKERGKPQQKPENDPRPLCGLLRCGECGRSITAEIKIKRQKNGNVHQYTYYRCTKKGVKCFQPHIRGEELDKQLSTAVKSYAMPAEWARGLSAMADKDEHDAAQLTTTASQATREEIMAIEKKLRILLEARLEEDIDRDTYREQKAELLSQKKSLEEKIANLNKGNIAWLEPLRNWIQDAETLNEINETTPLPLKKSFAQKIFGSNLFLKNKKIVSVSIPPYNTLLAARKNFFADTEKPFQIKERSSLVRVGRVELPSCPWQGHIIAAIRYPRVRRRVTELARALSPSERVQNRVRKDEILLTALILFILRTSGDLRETKSPAKSPSKSLMTKENISKSATGRNSRNETPRTCARGYRLNKKKKEGAGGLPCIC